jgi:rhodanese-related sulfurtransferase
MPNLPSPRSGHRLLRKAPIAAADSLAPAATHAAQQLLVIDLRPRRSFARGHLPGSHSLPAGLLLSGEWPEGDLLLVDGGDGEAERVRDALHSSGYHRRIQLLAGGFPAWQAAELPVSRPSRTSPWWRWRAWIGAAPVQNNSTPASSGASARRRADSAQLFGVGKILPGLARWSGSKA